MKLGIIGNGAIGRYVCEKAIENGHIVRAVILRPERIHEFADRHQETVYTSCVDDLPEDIDHFVDCAGHAALKSYGPPILRRGIDLTTVSIGALADPEVFDTLSRAALAGNARLHLASGSVGALDCLRAACVGKMQSVTYIGRKAPQSWKGSPAESKLDLDNLAAAEVHFEGCARDAALEYPKNANVAAAVAIAGIGFNDTQVKLIADPAVSENIHEVRASGDFGQFVIEIRGNPLPDNPRSSALAAMSIVSKLEQESQSIVF